MTVYVGVSKQEIWMICNKFIINNVCYRRPTIPKTSYQFNKKNTVVANFSYVITHLIHKKIAIFVIRISVSCLEIDNN